ncbi:hypothetical protein RG47T_3665 [Mucilaginibacter polytrichastri]|uniref:Uncharacterized protein n=1 Tax=Mucilaginibacter polytrichastri TaxID=1302689 RepID=A0A1Q6A2I7_9SPHI|nr:hypothetical protein RG47T_3665 [Mucilaginibacter polytrichastri]
MVAFQIFMLQEICLSFDFLREKIIVLQELQEFILFQNVCTS